MKERSLMKKVFKARDGNSKSRSRRKSWGGEVRKEERSERTREEIGKVETDKKQRFTPTYKVCIRSIFSITQLKKVRELSEYTIRGFLRSVVGVSRTDWLSCLLYTSRCV